MGEGAFARGRGGQRNGRRRLGRGRGGMGGGDRAWGHKIAPFANLHYMSFLLGKQIFTVLAIVIISLWNYSLS